MRKSRFTPEQIVGVLQEAEAGGPITEVGRRHGIPQTTFHRWRHKYGTMPVPDAKRLQAVEEEHRQRKRLVADQALNLQVAKDRLGKKW